jgi:tRNA(Ile)-lysidine synthetase-like protein
MKKLGHNRYKNLFISHLWKFISKVVTPEELKGSHLIAVSGGMDSMALLKVAHDLSCQKRIGPVRAVFIHHQTRAGQDQEAELVGEFCQQLGIPFKRLNLYGLKGHLGNFENEARLGRKKLFFQELRSNELLWQGHHLDDSFEWHLMQKCRTHQLKSTLGIPVRNYQIVRPFLCVSKMQIQRYVSIHNIPYLNDPTNLDTKFDRNYVRHQVIPFMRARYPYFLKQYVSQMNSLSLILGLNPFESKKSLSHQFSDGEIFLGHQFQSDQLLESIHRLSKVKRGEITNSLQSMLRAIENNKKGPFQFSGGVEAYFSGHVLMLYQKGYQNKDREVAQILEKISEEDLDQLKPKSLSDLHDSWKKLLTLEEGFLFMPGLCLVRENQSTQKTLNTSVYDSLFPEVSSVCKRRGWRFIPLYKCLGQWEAKKKKLPKELRIMPLHELSYLFSFQA